MIPVGSHGKVAQFKLGAFDGTRTRDLVFTKDVLYQLSYKGTRRNSMVGRAGFEPAKAKASGVTVRPIWPLWNRPTNDIGADGRNRTDNLRFTKPLLCQLSYVGALNTPSRDSGGKYTMPVLHCQTCTIRSHARRPYDSSSVTVKWNGALSRRCPVAGFRV